MKANKTKHLVLGDAVASSHKHVLEAVSDFEFDREENSIMFLLAAMGILTHDEHDRMVFSAGRFYRYNQVEFNPMDGRVTRVFD
ncbi:MAG TPA: hypothetical protein VM802_06860 [Chitinophaga sp.]|uniref:hypothetical protein n=1 Tax=Chitinophaga sp. TaxID=1869181 RepID=UPI002B5C69C6|nr:hypothetical protein [Chitinophaga sp.]HVI44570.1 hypothetical protein [Chitinophaga sp.]